MALMHGADFLAEAGPAVLRLKLLEVSHLAQSPRLTDEMREDARAAAAELRRLIGERPCVSLIDHAAKMDVAASFTGAAGRA
ncbi:MAG: hypothetical protein CTY15_11350 [Methylocystis sp.]|nr:MAG: hypothetical protein CTY15_11350 [Methylocystis sp.]